MNVLIDASNIVPDSGGFTHLKELLKNHETKNQDIIFVASSNNVIDELKINNKKVKYLSSLFLNNGKFFRLFWQIFVINSCIKKNKCTNQIYEKYAEKQLFIKEKVTRIYNCFNQNIICFPKI